VLEVCVSKTVRFRWRLAIFVAACAAIVATFSVRPGALSASLVISQVYGGGGNSGAPLANDFVELFNRGQEAVGLGGLSVQYASATGTGNFGANSGQMVVLPNVTLQPGQYFLVQLAGGTTGLPLPTADATGTINMSGSAGKVALVNSTTGLGCNGSSTACSTAQLALILDLVGFGNANFSEGAAAPTLSNTTAALRAGSGCSETDSNAADFTASAPAPRTSATAFHVCPPPTGPSGTGLSTPAELFPGDQTTLTVGVTPGTSPTSTSAAVTADLTAIGGSAAQTLYDDGTHGDVLASDWTFTLATSVADGTTPGAKTLPVAIADNLGRPGTTSIALAVKAPIIPISEIQGVEEASPLAGEDVATEGIVTALKAKGFFLQTAPGEEDDNAETSEGIYVYTGSTPPAAAAIGNRVTVNGRVSEYQSLTEIGGTVVVSPVSSGNLLPAAIPLTGADLDPAGSPSRLERYEGMRVSVEALTVVGPTDGYGAFWGVLPTVARPYREPGVDVSAPAIPEIPAGAPRYDGNPERLQVDMNELGGTALDVTTGQTASNISGVLDVLGSAYCLDAQSAPTVTGAPMAVVPVPAAAPGQFTVASFNMLHFFDTGDQAFADRVAKASLAVRTVLNMPDIIGVQEVGTIGALQALANRIQSDVGSATVVYVPYLEEGNDIGGIDVGFLVKASISVTSVTQEGKEARFTDPRDGSQDIINDRPPLVLRAVVPDPRGGPAFPVTVVVNHLRSLIDVDANTSSGVYARAKRRAGAEYLAGRLAAYQTAGEHVVVVGDFNAFQFNDGYVDVIGTVTGAPAPATEVLLPSADLVTPNYEDLIGKLVPNVAPYSYVEAGSAQVLDHVLVSASMMPRVSGLAYGRMNADFPVGSAADPTVAARLSDHDPAVAYFSFPTADLSVSASVAPTTALSGSSVAYTVVVENPAADPAVNVTMTMGLPAGFSMGTVTPAAGWACDSTLTGATCFIASLDAGRSTAFTIGAGIDCGMGSHDAPATVKVDAATYDSDASNNARTVVTTVSNPPPTVSNATTSLRWIWPVNHKLVLVKVGYDVADNCDPAPTCRLAVTSNEHDRKRGWLPSLPDWLVIDPHHVLLRAERLGPGHGRTYTIGIACSDATGNTSAPVNLFVTVPKSMGRK
jgi:uncharacterized protein